MILASLPAPLAAAAVPVRVLTVIDGDTIAVEMQGGAIEKIRLIGLDAPERGEHARCPAEAALAERAKLHLVGLLQLGAVTVETGHRERDRWGRVLAVVRVSGQDVAPLMISADMARAYMGGRRKPWC